MIYVPLFIGTTEVFFIILVTILVFGSDKIPEIVRGLAKVMKTVRNATDDIKNEITKSADEHGFTKEIEDITKQIERTKDEIEDAGSIKRNF